MVEAKIHAVDATKYPADKADKWSALPLDNDQWTLSHNALKIEIRSMIHALETFIGRLNNDDNIPDWVVKTVQEWWKSHTDHATDHCKSEESMYKPLLSERFMWPAEIDELHDALDSVQNKVQVAVMDGLNKTKSSLVAVKDALVTYEETMLKHFEAEEATA